MSADAATLIFTPPPFRRRRRAYIAAGLRRRTIFALPPRLSLSFRRFILYCRHFRQQMINSMPYSSFSSLICFARLIAQFSFLTPLLSSL